ncbi:hypothetical protein ZWY2020_029509 [Hordeum vulgare]|nr:hypothetical protein ZWY2020_029509 [Hordeum vulgare]
MTAACCADRPGHEARNGTRRPLYGVVAEPDPLWKTLRGIAATHVFLRSSPPRRAPERAMHRMLEEFRRHVGQVVGIGHVLYHGMFHLLTNTLFSVDGQDQLRDLLEDIVGLLAEPNVSDLYPLLRVLDLQGLRRWTTTHMNRVFHVMDKIIDTRLGLGLGEGEASPPPRRPRRPPGAHDHRQLSRRDVKAMLFDILAAGTETTKITVEWAMAELMRNPDVMAAVRAEMKAALPQEMVITEADVAKLPYLQAAVKESMRLHPVAPLLLPRMVVEEGVEIGGYAVPKGATLIFNSWSIMRDPTAWERPDEFLPERFLGKTELGMWGKEVKFIPLGSGRRLCPALPMVELLVPFMVASMLHAFQWRLPEGMSPHQVDVTERYTSDDILVMDVPLKLVPMFAV